MQRIGLTAGFLFSCFVISGLLGACSSERDVICEVSWTDNGDTELGTATLTYPSLDDVNAGVDNCEMEQESHPDRPDAATKHFCSCST